MTKIPVYSFCLPQNRYVVYVKSRLGLDDRITKMSSATAKASLVKNFPISVNVMVGTMCNLRCGHCPYHGTTGPSYFSSDQAMRVEVGERLMDELPQHETAVKFGQFEEPTLYPLFFRMTNHLSSKGVPVHLTTNGVVVSDENLDLLSRLNTLYISIDAATQETYSIVRGYDLQKVVANTERLIDVFHGAKIGVSFVRQKANWHETQMFLDYWFDKVDYVIFYVLLEFTTHEARYTPVGDLFLEPPTERVVCSSPFLETYVLPNGDVTLCCETLLMTGRREIPIMGNVMEESLANIWHGTRYTRYREALIDENWGVADICRTCPLWAASYTNTMREKDRIIHRNPTTLMVEKR